MLVLYVFLPLSSFPFSSLSISARDGRGLGVSNKRGWIDRKAGYMCRKMITIVVTKTCDVAPSRNQFID